MLTRREIIKGLALAPLFPAGILAAADPKLAAAREPSAYGDSEGDWQITQITFNQSPGVDCAHYVRFLNDAHTKPWTGYVRFHTVSTLEIDVPQAYFGEPLGIEWEKAKEFPQVLKWGWRRKYGDIIQGVRYGYEDKQGKMVVMHRYVKDVGWMLYEHNLRGIKAVS